MAKIHFINKQDENRGIIVGSVWPVAKVKGFSLKFKSKVKGDDGKLIDMTGKKLIDIDYGDGMLIVPNSRKREGSRDPDYIVYAYPNKQAK